MSDEDVNSRLSGAGEWCLGQVSLRESEARHRLLIGSWAQAVWETDASGVVVTDSPSWRAYTGQTLGEWLGYGWLDAVHPDDRAYAERQWRETVAARGLLNAEFRLRGPDGEWRWTNVRAAPVLDADGQIEKWARMNIDIAERKQAEAVLRESEERQAFLLRLSDALRPLSDPGDVQQAAMRILCEGLDVARASFYEIGDDQEHFRVSQIYSAVEHPAATPYLRFSTLGFLLSAYRAGETLVFDDIANDPRFDKPTSAHIVEARSAAATIAVPLVKDGRLIAKVAVHRLTPHHWSAHEIAMVQETAERTWAAAERGRAEAALRASEERQAFLLRLSDVIRPMNDAAQIERAAVTLLGEALGATRTFYATIDEGEASWSVRQDYAPGLVSSAGTFPFSTFQHRRRAQWEAGRMSNVSDSETEPSFDEEDRAAYTALGTRAAIGIPLVRKGRFDALLAVTQAEPRYWTEAEQTLARETAERVWMALERVRAEDAVRSSERFARALLEGVPQLVWRAVDGGDWTWASPQWTEFTGQAEPDSYEHGWLDVVHPDDRDMALASWHQAKKTGKLEMDLRLRHAASGRYRWFQTRATPVRAADGAIVEWLGTSTDIDDLRVLQDRQQVLVAELQHRVRNILTVVRSVFTRTAEGDVALDHVVDHFRGRLDNLARTQVVVTRDASGKADLYNLIYDELMSVGFADSPNVSIDGPKVALGSKTAESIGLAVHELTTNALKYGALRISGARLTVRWSTNMDCGDTPTLNLTWLEQGVPAVPLRPFRQGFGSELIEEALPYRLGADTKLEFRPGGVRCTICVPLTDGAAPADPWEDR